MMPTRQCPLTAAAFRELGALSGLLITAPLERQLPAVLCDAVWEHTSEMLLPTCAGLLHAPTPLM